MKSRLIHLSQQIFDSPLAIIPEKLESILVALGPRFGLADSSLDFLITSGVLRRTHIPEDAIKRGSTLGILDSYIQPKRADYYDEDDDTSSDSNSPPEKPYHLTSTGIAVIPVSGVLMKRAGWMS